MPAFAVRVKSFGQSLSRISDTPGKIIQAIDQMAVSGKRVETQQLMKVVAERMESAVRAELAICWARSGLKSKSGALYAAAVSNAKITATSTGFLISMADGCPDDVYARASSFKHGAVRQPLTKEKGSLYEDLPTGQMRPRKYAAGEFGERAKRTLKKSMSKAHSATGQTSFGTESFVPPKPGFFRFTSEQVARLNAKRDLYTAEIIRGLKGVANAG